MNTPMQELLEELDIFSQQLSDIAHARNDPDPNESPLFFKLSNEVDGLIEKYGEIQQQNQSGGTIADFNEGC